MARIFKYEIPIADRFYLNMPEGAEVLTVQTQRGIPYLWAIVEPKAPLRKKWFEVRGTGHEVGDVAHYISTIQMQDGALVFHVFHALRGA